MWVAGAFVVWVAMIPIFLTYYRLTQDLGVIRTLENQLVFSGKVWNWLTPSPYNWLWHQVSFALPRATLFTAEDAIFPGFIAIGIFIASFFIKNIPTWLRGLRWAALATALFALGPYAQGLPWKIPMPFSMLWHIFPPLKATRNPNRWALFTVQVICFLTAYMFSRFYSRKRIYIIANTLCMALIAVEGLSVMIPEKSTVIEQLSFYQSLYPPNKNHIFIEVPYSRAYESSAMFASTYHWNKIINGYNGMWPPVQTQLENELEKFPSADTISLLQALDVDMVILHEDKMEDHLHHVLKRLMIDRNISFIKRINTISLWHLNKGEPRAVLNLKTDLRILGPSKFVAGCNNLAIDIVPSHKKFIFNPRAPFRWWFRPIALPWIISAYTDQHSRVIEKSPWWAPGLFHNPNCTKSFKATMKAGDHEIITDINIFGTTLTLKKQIEVVPAQIAQLPLFLRLPKYYQPVPLDQMKVDFKGSFNDQEALQIDNTLNGEITITNPGPYYWVTRYPNQLALNARLVCDDFVASQDIALIHDLFPGDSLTQSVRLQLPPFYKHCFLYVNCYGMLPHHERFWFPKSNEKLIFSLQT